MPIKRIQPKDTTQYIQLRGDEWNWHRRAIAFTLLPSPDPEKAAEGWQDVAYYSEGIMDPTLSAKKPEWVYVLVNKGVPGICKIGMTTTSVAERVKQINSATGVITPWFPIYSYKCINSYVLEQATHQRLEEMGYRVNPKREGFEIPSDAAIAVIEQLATQLTVSPKDFTDPMVTRDFY